MSLDLLNKRLAAMGGNQEGRMKKQKQGSLDKALMYSEQAETILFNNKETRVILNRYKQKIDYDDKTISAPFGVGLKIGSMFKWIEEGTDWIVYLKEGQDAYFTGVCRRAIHDIKFKDEFGVVHSIKAAVRGPVETKIRSDRKGDVSFDSANNSLYCIIPNTEETRCIQRYSRVSIDNMMWKVSVTDSLSEPGIIELELLEDYKNKIEDSDLISDNQNKDSISKKVVINSSLDGIETLELDEIFKLWAKIDVDGVYNEKLSSEAIFSVDDTQLAIISNDNTITPIGTGNILVTISVPRIKFSKQYAIRVVNSVLPPSIVYEIVGSKKVRSLGLSEYYIHSFVDGIEQSVSGGSWGLKQNDRLFSIDSHSDEKITFKWKTGMFGTVELDYSVGEQIVAKKIIEVTSLI